jgi:hypothetical protein
VVASARVITVRPKDVIVLKLNTVVLLIEVIGYGTGATCSMIEA